MSKMEQSLRKDLEERTSAMQTLQTQLKNCKSNLLKKVETQSEKIVEQKKEIDDLQRLVSKYETQAKQSRYLHEVLERKNAQKMQESINRRARDDAQKAKNVEEERRKVQVAEARQRMLEMLAEEEEEKRRVDERRKATEKARREREEAERKARENEERERKERERKGKLRREQEWETATRSEELRCKHRDEIKWGYRRWTELCALERCRALMDEFEQFRFSESQPLTVRSVPWPVLEDPFRFDPSDLEWWMVEQFFGKAKSLIGTDVKEYNQLIERSHRMFHPDRWKSRRLLQSVKNRVLRDTLERAGNIVSQAVTPLWKESRG